MVWMLSMDLVMGHRKYKKDIGIWFNAGRVYGAFHRRNLPIIYFVD